MLPSYSGLFEVRPEYRILTGYASFVGLLDVITGHPAVGVGLQFNWPSTFLRIRNESGSYLAMLLSTLSWATQAETAWLRACVFSGVANTICRAVG